MSRAAVCYNIPILYEHADTHPQPAAAQTVAAVESTAPDPAASNLVTAALHTDVGLVRGHNEDFYGCWEPRTAAEEAAVGWVYVVADGVGGAAAGEIASQHATEEMLRHFAASAEPDEPERLRQAVQHANDAVRRLAGDGIGRGGYMATTLVAAVVRPQRALLVNVGDSRGYHLHNGALRQVTKDQSLVAQLLEEGAITPEEAVNHPRRNVILSSLGPTREPRIDLFEVAIAPGDQLLLCSDGLTRHLDDGEIAAIMQRAAPADAAQTLVELANARGGSDNITVAVIQIGPRAETPDTPTAEPTAGPRVIASAPRHAPGLWFYTILLALIEAALIIAVWYWLRV